MMENKKIVAGFLMDENTTLSFVEVCQRCNVTEDELLEMMEYGLFNHFDANTINRIQSASRLQQDLGINLPGVVLVIELLDELEQLRNELNILQRHLEHK